MNRSGLEPGRVAAATLVLGGLLVALFPGLSARVIRIVIVAGAAGTALFVLRTQAARAWWTSPFNVVRHRPNAPGSSPELDRVAAKFEGRRQPVPGGTALPPETIRLLRPLVVAAMARHRGPGADAELSALTRALPELEPQVWPRWFQTRSPGPTRVAQAVHQVLDDIDRMEAHALHSDSTPTERADPE
ncbi:MAG: hypothetical protein HKO53_15750 [Gemmatimonadetes bacterium]|nr:hypothetical protein [Gemmatimonadota bacterium]